MTPRLTFTPAEVAEFQPRAQHFIHEHGYFHSVEFMAWIDRQIAALCAPLDLPRDRLTGAPAAHLRWQGAHEAFDEFLAARCVCASPP